MMRNAEKIPGHASHSSACPHSCGRMIVKSLPGEGLGMDPIDATPPRNVMYRNPSSIACSNLITTLNPQVQTRKPKPSTRGLCDARV